MTGDGPGPDGRFSDDVAILEAALRAGDLTALSPLADELNARGHPHGERLCLLASAAGESESFSLTLELAGLFLEVAAADATEEGVLTVQRAFSKALELWAAMMGD